jgi:hypothetical protein
MDPCSILKLTLTDPSKQFPAIVLTQFLQNSLTYNKNGQPIIRIKISLPYYPWIASHLSGWLSVKWYLFISDVTTSNKYQALTIPGWIMWSSHTRITPPTAATRICAIQLVGSIPTRLARNPPITPPSNPMTRSAIRPKPTPRMSSPANQPAIIPLIIHIIIPINYLLVSVLRIETHHYPERCLEFVKFVIDSFLKKRIAFDFKHPSNF